MRQIRIQASRSPQGETLCYISRFSPRSSSNDHQFSDEQDSNWNDYKKRRVSRATHGVARGFGNARSQTAHCLKTSASESANLKRVDSLSGTVSVKLRNVLILHKKTTFQIQAIEHKESRFLKLVEEQHESVKRVQIAHSEHMETLNAVCDELKRRGVIFRCLARSDLTETTISDDVDLVISVGGDGTFLDASHHIEFTPILGINSSTSSSFGHFCIANITNFKEVLDKIEADEQPLEQLLRLEMSINGEVLPDLVLNEVLVAHTHPAATSRYFISVGGVVEEHRSSGIWIGTPAGSTGSLRSAGAPVMRITDNRYEFIIREACMRPNEDWKLLKGVLNSDQAIEVVSQMRTGAFYIDGQHIQYQFGLGDALVVKPSEKYLNAYIAKDVNDIFLS